jgi:uncharacterized membrane protein YgaE (UPF0421/DUF939 family)
MAMSKAVLNIWFAVDGVFWARSLTVAYLFGIAPAHACLIADWLMNSNPDRLLFTAFVGAVVAFAVSAFVFRTMDGPYAVALIAAICAAIIAAVCSWLSSEKIEERTPSY